MAPLAKASDSWAVATALRNAVYPPMSASRRAPSALRGGAGPSVPRSITNRIVPEFDRRVHHREDVLRRYLVHDRVDGRQEIPAALAERPDRPAHLRTDLVGRAVRQYMLRID